jgi:hypothetical protein
VVTGQHFMQTTIAVELSGKRRVVFEQDAVTVRWALIFLLDPLLGLKAHLVARKKIDCWLTVAWVVFAAA